MLRFSYATDPGLAKPGWFIDDVKVDRRRQRAIYVTDFETSGGRRRAGSSTAAAGRRTRTRALHAGLAVRRRRRRGRPPTTPTTWRCATGPASTSTARARTTATRSRFAAGLLLAYTDEAHGYGNAGTDDPPAQSPLDANPQPGRTTPNLNDAAFSAGNTFNDSTPHRQLRRPGLGDGNWEFRYDCLGLKVLKLAGDDEGPGDLAPGGTNTNLTGDVQFTTGHGCAPFNYGHKGAAGANAAPVAVPQVKSRTVAPGQPVTFDGSGSYDDRDTSSALRYQWDFDADGRYDATGVRATHTFAKEGRYTVTLRVTDSAGLSSTASIVITVAPPSRGRPGTMPATGGSTTAALAALACLIAAGLLRRRARG